MTDGLPPRVAVITDGKSDGKRWYYFRSPQTGMVKLPDPARDLAGFHRAYGDAEDLRQRLLEGKKPAADDSFAALVDGYLKSVEYKALADSTQVDYARLCDVVKSELGDVPYRFTTKKMIKEVRDDLAGTVRKANKVVAMLSILYSWAQQEEKVDDGFNPAAGLKKLQRKGGVKEYEPWSDAEVDWAVADAPLHVLTPILIALYTGQRREDVVTMTWQQVQGDSLRVKTSKTRTLLDMPCHPVLKAHLDQLPKRRAMIPFPTAPICSNANGKPYATANALSGALRRFVEGHDRIPNNRSMHGLRYAAAARMEAGGATVAAIEAVLGHRTFRMALKYAGARLRAAQGVAAMKGTAE